MLFFSCNLIMNVTTAEQKAVVVMSFSVSLTSLLLDAQMLMKQEVIYEGHIQSWNFAPAPLGAILIVRIKLKGQNI